jgi:hypothetical protein
MVRHERTLPPRAMAGADGEDDPVRDIGEDDDLDELEEDEDEEDESDEDVFDDDERDMRSTSEVGTGWGRSG